MRHGASPELRGYEMGGGIRSKKSEQTLNGTSNEGEESAMKGKSIDLGGAQTKVFGDSEADMVAALCALCGRV